jgi:hypothetical protein
MRSTLTNLTNLSLEKCPQMKTVPKGSSIQANLATRTAPKKVSNLIEGIRTMNLSALQSGTWRYTVATLLSVCFLSIVANAAIIRSSTDSINMQHSTDGGTNTLVTTSPIRAGSAAFKHEIVNGGKRAEFEDTRVNVGGTYWYGWSFYHPSSPGVPSGGWSILNQWFIGNRPATDWPCGGAGHKLGVENQGAGYKLKFDMQYSTSGGSAITCTKYDLATFDQIKDQWVDIVMQAKWTANTDGFIKLWMRIGGASGTWVQKINYTGRSQADGSYGPYFKWGAYTEVVANGPRTVYSDEYRLGDSNSHFAEVAPGGDTPSQYEAEYATRSGPVVATNVAGYTGTGFLDYGTSTSEYATFDVYMASAATKYLDFRYGNGGSSNRPMEITVNGTVVYAQMPFNPTGSWSTWATTTTSTNLNAGKNTVKVRIATTSGSPNIDNLIIR